MILMSILKIAGEGFNRYMVECEFATISIITHINPSFNRYMVECEYYLIILKLILQRQF